MQRIVYIQNNSVMCVGVRGYEKSTKKTRGNNRNIQQMVYICTGGLWGRYANEVVLVRNITPCIYRITVHYARVGRVVDEINKKVISDVYNGRCAHAGVACGGWFVHRVVLVRYSTTCTCIIMVVCVCEWVGVCAITIQNG